MSDSDSDDSRLSGSDGSENDYESDSGSEAASGSEVESGSDISRSDVEDDREDAEENFGNVAWGRQKKSYYSSSKAAESSDEEAAREEETEAKRLQQAKLVALRDEDISIGVPVAVSDKKDKGKKKVVGNDAELLSSLNKDLSGLTGKGHSDSISALETLSKSDRLAQISQDTPELVQLIKEFRGRLSELKDYIMPLLDRVRGGELATAQGISYLETKFHLLLSYCMNVAFFLLLKASGQTVENHPVILQLVRLRTTMEKLRPLDQKLKYQLDKLLRKGAAQAQAAADEKTADALQFKPRPKELVSKMDEDDEGDGLYKAPKLSAMRFEEEDREQSKKERRDAMLRKRASRSELVRDLRNELSEKPEEVAGNEDFAMHASDDDVRKYEEENMTRLSRKKSDLARKKRTAFGDQFAALDDFGDIVVEGDEGAEHHKSVRRYINKVDQATRERTGPSGDADLPYHGFESKQQRKRKPTADDAGSDDGFNAGPAPQEDEFYTEAKAKHSEKKHRKEEARKPAMPTPFDDSVKGDKRGATVQILKNRGLTPHRPKEQRNSRVRLRKRFEDAQKRRKGQVRDMRSEGKAYGGEQTGIRTNVSRSVRLQ